MTVKLITIETDKSKLIPWKKTDNCHLKAPGGWVATQKGRNNKDYWTKIKGKNSLLEVNPQDNSTLLDAYYCSYIWVAHFSLKHFT